MRWVSWDQKPAWFNNTALDSCLSPAGYQPRIREIFAHSRQRFTICTCVDSDSMHHPERTPPVGVLFKAAHDGVVRRELRNDPYIPDWMFVQTQIKGSYRTEDVWDLLHRTLPRVEHLWQSTVILLDWYSAHRDERIADFIRERGHTLLLHGGGTTAYEQVNDTHLHAVLQHKLKQLEVAVFYGDLASGTDLGKVACSSRQDLCYMVKAVWSELEHQAISHKAYGQTGPMWPLTGPIHKKDVCRDLWDVVKDMCPGPNDNEIGTEIRDEAEKFVAEADVEIQ